MSSRLQRDPSEVRPPKRSWKQSIKASIDPAVKVAKKYVSFIGPGLVVSVAYMDPGNYLTLVLLGASYEYKLCFVIFMSNVFAIILQSLCVKLGTVTGLDLAEMCRLHLPYKLNLLLYICAEIAIIATDLAEVVGTAIALEIIFGIPLVYGVLITIVDVMIILIAYQRDGSMRKTRAFEFLVLALVCCTCACFVLELCKCDFGPGSVSAIFKGFLPIYKQVWKEKHALFLSCGIVGSTVMPHSLFLGSALVQARLLEYDEQNVSGSALLHRAIESFASTDSRDLESTNPHTGILQGISDGSKLQAKYKPSLQAINYCLDYSYFELVFSLFVVAVFVNSAILIVAGSTLYGKPDAGEADLLSIYEMLSFYLSPAAGMVFALSMLFSGQSAGIVCTMAGQIISEGFVNWTIKPWKRRIVTRALAIAPVFVVILLLGREGMSRILNSSQVLLSFILPVVSAPLIYFTCNKKYMMVTENLIGGRHENGDGNETTALLSRNNSSVAAGPFSVPRTVSFENGKFLRITSILTWVLISFLNFYLLFAFANGADI